MIVKRQKYLKQIVQHVKWKSLMQNYSIIAFQFNQKQEDISIIITSTI